MIGTIEEVTNGTEFRFSFFFFCLCDLFIPVWCFKDFHCNVIEVAPYSPLIIPMILQASRGGTYLFLAYLRVTVEWRSGVTVKLLRVGVWSHEAKLAETRRW